MEICCRPFTAVFSSNAAKNLIASNDPLVCCSSISVHANLFGISYPCGKRCPWACVWGHLGGPFIFTATSKEQVGVSGEKECRNSKLQHSVTATNLTNTLGVYAHLKSGHRGGMLPYGNSQKLSNPDSELLLMLLITFLSCCDFRVKPHNDKGGESLFNQRVNLNLVVFVQEKINLSYEIIAGITVSLSLSSACTVYCQLADRSSACVFICTRLAGSCDDGMCWVFFSVVNKEQRMWRGAWRRAGSIPPSAVKTYLYKHWHWEDK